MRRKMGGAAALVNCCDYFSFRAVRTQESPLEIHLRSY